MYGMTRDIGVTQHIRDVKRLMDSGAISAHCGKSLLGQLKHCLTGNDVARVAAGIERLRDGKEQRKEDAYAE